MKPLAQIGFICQSLVHASSSVQTQLKPGDPYSNIITGGLILPDYNKWAALVYEWVKHSVQPWAKEVESWYWELWNEPNGFTGRNQRRIFKLYDYTAGCGKPGIAAARIGGINIAGTASENAQQWLRAFVKHCFEDTNYADGKNWSTWMWYCSYKGFAKLVDGHGTRWIWPGSWWISMQASNSGLLPAT